MPSQARAPRVPLPRVARGQQRSLVSPIAVYPQVSIRAGQPLDRCPTFQAGHAGSIPSPAPPIAVSQALPLGQACRGPQLPCEMSPPSRVLDC
jgi:hypothetical protein